MDISSARSKQRESMNQFNENQNSQSHGDRDLTFQEWRILKWTEENRALFEFHGATCPAISWQNEALALFQGSESDRHSNRLDDVDNNRDFPSNIPPPPGLSNMTPDLRQLMFTENTTPVMLYSAHSSRHGSRPSSSNSRSGRISLYSARSDSSFSSASSNRSVHYSGDESGSSEDEDRPSSRIFATPGYNKPARFAGGKNSHCSSSCDETRPNGSASSEYDPGVKGLDHNGFEQVSCGQTDNIPPECIRQTNPRIGSLGKTDAIPSGTPHGNSGAILPSFTNGETPCQVYNACSERQLSAEKGFYTNSQPTPIWIPRLPLIENGLASPRPEPRRKKKAPAVPYSKQRRALPPIRTAKAEDDKRSNGSRPETPPQPAMVDSPTNLINERMPVADITPLVAAFNKLQPLPPIKPRQLPISSAGTANQTDQSIGTYDESSPINDKICPKAQADQSDGVKGTTQFQDGQTDSIENASLQSTVDKYADSPDGETPCQTPEHSDWIDQLFLKDDVVYEGTGNCVFTTPDFPVPVSRRVWSGRQIFQQKFGLQHARCLTPINEQVPLSANKIGSTPSAEYSQDGVSGKTNGLTRDRGNAEISSRGFKASGIYPDQHDNIHTDTSHALTSSRQIPVDYHLADSPGFTKTTTLKTESPKKEAPPQENRLAKFLEEFKNSTGKREKQPLKRKPFAWDPNPRVNKSLNNNTPTKQSNRKEEGRIGATERTSEQRTQSFKSPQNRLTNFREEFNDSMAAKRKAMSDKREAIKANAPNAVSKKNSAKRRPYYRSDIPSRLLGGKDGYPRTRIPVPVRMLDRTRPVRPMLAGQYHLRSTIPHRLRAPMKGCPASRIPLPVWMMKKLGLRGCVCEKYDRRRDFQWLQKTDSNGFPTRLPLPLWMLARLAKAKAAQTQLYRHGHAHDMKLMHMHVNDTDETGKSSKQQTKPSSQHKKGSLPRIMFPSLGNFCQRLGNNKRGYI